MPTHLQDGFSTTISIGGSGVTFWEVSVTPPGIDGGEPIDQTTMHNDTYMTFSPQSLFTLTAASAEGAYDPAIYTAILAVINVESEITVNFPDGSTYAFRGFMKSFAPGALAKGAQPRATFTIAITNRDEDGDESPPVFTPGV